MRLRTRLSSATGIVVFAALWLSLSGAGRVAAQGGEPRSFAIRGAKVVPVSGAPLENATVVVSRGVITAVGTNVAIPCGRLGDRRKGIDGVSGACGCVHGRGRGSNAGERRRAARPTPNLRFREGPKTGQRLHHGAMPRMKSTWEMRESRVGAALDLRPRFLLPRAVCFRDKPRC